MRSPATLGSENFRKLVRQRTGRRCRRSPRRSLPADRLDALEAYLLTLGRNDDDDHGDREHAAAAAAESRRAIRDPRCATPARSPPAGTPTNGLPAIGPPWTQLVAYDLNDGIGEVAHSRRHVARPRRAGHHRHGQRAAEERSGGDRRRPGVHRQRSGSHAARLRQGRPARCSGSTKSRRIPRAFPRSTPIDGRQYIAFSAGASWGTGGDPVWRNGVPSQAVRRRRRRATTCSRCPRVGEMNCVASREPPSMQRKSSHSRPRQRDRGLGGRDEPPVSADGARRRRRQVRRRSTARPMRSKRVTWRTRTLVGDERLTQWKLALRPDGLSAPRCRRARRCGRSSTSWRRRADRPSARPIAKPLGPAA